MANLTKTHENSREVRYEGNSGGLLHDLGISDAPRQVTIVDKPTGTSGTGIGANAGRDARNDLESKLSRR